MRKLLAFFILLSSTSLWADSFSDGVKAVNAGKYYDAYVIWWPLARQGDADAQHNLAVLYDLGLGIAQNQVSAVKWYYRAAQQEHADSQNNLGMMYFYGQGVDKDLNLAKKWLVKAVEHNHTQAQINLQRVNQVLSQ